MSRETIVFVMLMGLIVGLSADKIRPRDGLGVFADVVVSLIGGLVASLILKWTTWPIDAGIATKIIVITAGAVLLLLIARLVFLKGRKR